ncbi:MAG TPA: hypothetical protein VH280_02620 [Verrucomicrobiae bacterium]|nr:hypothetical protein [Verrucomicrobiae bacterium]
MDPNKALKNFLDACRDWHKNSLMLGDQNDRDIAIEELNVLLMWIRSGGFLPNDPRRPE